MRALTLKINILYKFSISRIRSETTEKQQNTKTKRVKSTANRKHIHLPCSHYFESQKFTNERLNTNKKKRILLFCSNDNNGVTNSKADIIAIQNIDDKYAASSRARGGQFCSF